MTSALIFSLWIVPQFEFLSLNMNVLLLFLQERKYVSHRNIQRSDWDSGVRRSEFTW